jgi:chondroitin AC lyase
MARQWGWGHSQGSPDSTLAGQVQLALGYWLDNDFINVGNWFPNDISVPYIVGTSMLIMGGAITLTSGQSSAADSILARRADKALPGVNYQPRVLTGANAVLLSKNIVIEGAVTDDDDTIETGMSAIFDEIAVGTTLAAEGIQADESFHQHGAQLYSGGYGLDFSRDTSFFANLARGTRFALDPTTQAILAAYMLDGQQWMTCGNLIDYGAKGRGITRKAACTNDLSLSWACNDMASLNGPRATEFEAFSDRISQDDVHGADAPAGSRGFWRSDFATFRSNAFYASVKMVSTRTNGSESGNGEGLKNFYVAQGCTYLMCSGDEYFNIFPVWDWRRVPGVTCGQGTAPLPQLGWSGGTGLNTFAGVVSDGTCGAAAMHFEVDQDVPATARKAWFYFGLELVCLGAAIASTAEPTIFTSINQCHLNGSVTTYDGTTVSTAPAGPTTSTLDWVYHGGIGYIFPAPTSVVVQAKSQPGNWHDINTSQPDASLSEDVFSLWIDHGAKPSSATYAYVVLPGSQSGVSSYASDVPVSVLSNSSDLQAAQRSSEGLTQAVFHGAGSLQVGAGLTLTTDSPCLLMIRQQRGGLALCVSDPKQSRQQVTITLTGQYTGTGTTYDAGTGLTSAVIGFAQGMAAGQTASLTLTSA